MEETTINLGYKPNSPVVLDAIQAIEMRQYLRLIYSQHNAEILERSLNWERKHRGDCHQEDTVYCVKELPSLLTTSEIVLWDLNLWNSAVSGSKVFEKTLCDPTLFRPDGTQAVKPQLWFLLGNMWNGTLSEKGPGIARLIFPAVSSFSRNWDDPEFCLGFVSIGMTDEGDPVVEPSYLWLKEPLDETCAPIIAAMEFMRTTIATKERINTPRQYRRNAERHGIDLPSVYCVRLRRQAGQRHNGSASEREFHCQWLVGAHWRNQYYPSDGRHRPVYILPYVKGDPSKPFKAPGEKVYAVIR